ncbi:MAG: hypothetical protein ACERKD_22245 [Prolixibacteraceae bacterium]
MSNLWKQSGVPHKGWTLIDVIDIREDGQSECDTSYEECMMCGHEKIRYVHVVTHKEVDEEFSVGCICAENMTNDYVNPKRLERELKNKAIRRRTWVRKVWKVNLNGNHYLNYHDHLLLIYMDKRSDKYKVRFGEIFGRKRFDTIKEAKNAVFDGILYLKDKDKW